MARSVVGFHGANNGIGRHLRRLDEAGITPVAKSVNNVGFALEAANYNTRTTPQVILRFTNPGGRPNDEPPYDLPADQAANVLWDAYMWSLSRAPEFTHEYRSRIWLEMMNEVDTHTHAPHLGAVCYFLAKRAVAEGFKVALGGFNAGQPEPHMWLSYFGALLEMCHNYPEQVAISLHEGKLSNIQSHPVNFYPHLIGRFKYLFEAADSLGYQRPPTFVSEWSWAYNNMPDDDTALRDIMWIANLAALHPNMLGIMLWNLNPGAEWGSLPGKLTNLIPKVSELTLHSEFDGSGAPSIPPAPNPKPDPNPTPTDQEERFKRASLDEQISRGIWLNPKGALYKAIKKDGLEIVHREIYMEGHALQAGESVDGQRWLYIWSKDSGVRRIPAPSQ